MSFWSKSKQALGRFIPSHVNDPIGLIRRMLSSNKKAASFTLWLTGASILATPIDWVLQRFELRTRQKIRSGQTGPHIFICGPARSGTTLVYQVLANNLDNVSFIRNFTVAFSRSPIVASRLFTKQSSTGQKPDYENYYGKTAGLQSPSEANHLWNQWVDVDESDFRTLLTPEGAAKMAEFFNCFSAQQGKPTLSKNNNLNAFADRVSSSLDNTYFICLQRETKFLAQSLIKARLEINGNIKQSYGVTNVQNELKNEGDPALPVVPVLEQIDFLNSLAKEQQEKIGSDRFWIVSYEEFCKNPSALIDKVNTEILNVNEKDKSVPLPPITHNNRCTNPEIFQQIENELQRRARPKPQNSEQKVEAHYETK